MERRTRKATVRLTEEELARLKEAARRAGWWAGVLGALASE